MDWYGGSPLMTVLETVEVGRDEPISGADSGREEADQFAAHMIWMDEAPMLPERSYLIRFACDQATAQVTDLTYRIDVDTQEQLAAKTLARDEIGYCKIALDRAVAYDAFSENRRTGSFVLIDKLSDATVGAGTISFALRRASNIKWHEMRVDQAARARANQQKPCVLWFTGLSGAGKSTVADRLEHELHAVGKRTYLLDGDNVRHGLNKDLGFTDQDRVENIRRVAEVARLMCDAGLIVLVSFISPFRSERQMARALMGDDEFVEIFVDAPLAVCEERDPKGLYRKARAGELKNFTGIDSDYETPLNAEITLKSGEAEPRILVDQVIEYLKRGGRI